MGKVDLANAIPFYAKRNAYRELARGQVVGLEAQGIRKPDGARGPCVVYEAEEDGHLTGSYVLAIVTTHIIDPATQRGVLLFRRVRPHCSLFGPLEDQ